MADFPELSVFAATSAQIDESRKRTHASWSRGLSVEAYVERDNIMDLQEHAADGKLVTWVLAPRSDPTSLDFKCSCETYRRMAIVAHPSSTSASSVVCYGIASVYTPSQHRGHGYASLMMSLLHWVLAPRSSLPAEFPAIWGAPPAPHLQDAVFSVLYSDVGRTFYARCGPEPSPDRPLGWITKSPVSTQWDLPPVPTVGDTPAWKWLSRADCLDVWEQDSALIQAEAAVLAGAKGRTVCAFLPDNGVAQFNIQRLMTFGAGLQPVYPPEPWGVQLIGEEQLTFATWTFEPGTKVMVITRLRVSPVAFPKLLEAVSSKARELGFETVEAWNLPHELKEVAKSTRTFERDEHLPAVKWYGGEPDDSVEWIFNEKFCWC